MKGDYLVVDIGSKTTDVVYVQKGLPIESKSITIEKAIVKCRKYNLRLMDSYTLEFHGNSRHGESADREGYTGA